MRVKPWQFFALRTHSTRWHGYKKPKHDERERERELNTRTGASSHTNPVAWENTWACSFTEQLGHASEYLQRESALVECIRLSSLLPSLICASTQKDKTASSSVHSNVVFFLQKRQKPTEAERKPNGTDAVPLAAETKQRSGDNSTGQIIEKRAAKN